MWWEHKNQKNRGSVLHIEIMFILCFSATDSLGGKGESYVWLAEMISREKRLRGPCV